jgi:ribosomal-protein-alanine N-acetyltransferase
MAAAKPTVTVRAFEMRDLPRIVRIDLESFELDAWPREVFLDYTRGAPDLFLVATVDGGGAGDRIAGYTIARLTRHGAEIASLAVRPLYRQRGVATALLKTTLRKLRRSGANAVWLMVRPRNEDAIRLYRKFGFVRTGTVPNHYADGSSGWRMRLGLGVNPNLNPSARPR